VIAIDEALGDPIFIDTSKPQYPVFSAMHGAGVWDPELIADGLTGFTQALQVMEKIAINRASPVALEQHPINQELAAKVLADIQQHNPIAGTDYWEIFLEE
jgi:hypothetical protein